MPCTDGGTPVTMDRLFGLVKVGTTASPSRAVPDASTPENQGATPAPTASVM